MQVPFEILLLFELGQRNIIVSQNAKVSSLATSLLKFKRGHRERDWGASVRRWLLGKGSARRLAATDYRDERVREKVGYKKVKGCLRAGLVCWGKGRRTETSCFVEYIDEPSRRFVPLKVPCPVVSHFTTKPFAARLESSVV